MLGELQFFDVDLPSYIGYDYIHLRNKENADRCTDGQKLMLIEYDILVSSQVLGSVLRDSCRSTHNRLGVASPCRRVKRWHISLVDLISGSTRKASVIPSLLRSHYLFLERDNESRLYQSCVSLNSSDWKSL